MVTIVSEIAEPLELIDGAALELPERTRSLTAARVLAGCVDGAAAGAVVALVGFSVYTAILTALLWATLMAAVAPVNRQRINRQAITRTVVVCGFACWVSGAFLDLHRSAAVFVVILGVAAAAAYLSRTIAGVLVRSPERVVIVGEIGDREAVAREAMMLSRGRVRAVAVIGPEGLAGAVAVHRPDAVLVVPGPGLAGRQVQRIAWHAERLGVPLLINTRLHDVAARRTAPLRVGGLSLLHVAPAQRDGLVKLVKHTWERVAAAAALLVLLVPMLVIAVIIRIDSPGPAFFRQRRVGRHGKPFTMLKFRTMCADAEQRRATLSPREGHVLFKMARDPRVTRVGAFLRRYSLDEIPQFINVLRGEMALVGPRPALLSEVEEYDDDPRRRLAVRPGLTGLWQVSGRSDLSWEESVRLDLDYVDNWSLRLDLAIVVRTVRAVLGHSGAY